MAQPTDKDNPSFIQGAAPRTVLFANSSISRVSNRLRDEHMLGRLIAALDEHRRVFATVGVSHAVMLEPALRAAIEK